MTRLSQRKLPSQAPKITKMNKRLPNHMWKWNHESNPPPPRIWPSSFRSRSFQVDTDREYRTENASKIKKFGKCKLFYRAVSQVSTSQNYLNLLHTCLCKMLNSCNLDIEISIFNFMLV